MVKIKSSKHAYMLECNDECIYWSRPNSSPLTMSCEPDSNTYALGVGIRSSSNSQEFYDFERTKKFLKSIDRTKNVLPITIDFDSFDNDREYTDIETNDACRVPKCEWSTVEFSIDGGNEKERGMFLFQNNGTPWFAGDGYDMPNSAWFDYDNDEYGKEFMSKFTDVEDGSAELINFYSYFIDGMLKSIEEQENALMTEAEAKKKKKAKDQERINTALSKLVSSNITDEVEDFSKSNKIDIEKVVEFANKLYAAMR